MSELETETELAAELDAVVRAVPGVLQTYPARPALLAAVTQAASVVLRTPVAPPVAVSHDTDGVSVRVTIAVSDQRPAAETCRAVHDAVVAHLAELAARAGRPVPSAGDPSADADADADSIARVTVEVARIG